MIHATLIAAWRGGRWRGVLVRGPSGAGKSDLALRALAQGWRLVADDRVHVWPSGGELYGTAPGALAGLLEMRGLGVWPQSRLRFAAIALVIDDCPPDQVERIPVPARLELCGAVLSCLRLPLLEPSTVAKLDPALDAALRGAL